MPMAPPPPVYDPADVTAAWLTEVLLAAGQLPGTSGTAGNAGGHGDTGRVVGFTTEPIGTGQVGANIRYRLAYEPATANDTAPASVVAKFAAADEVSRAAGIATRTYETEVAFYRDLAATVDVSRPTCMFAAIEPGTADVVLILEDLAPAIQGDQIAGCTVEQARLAMDEAARLHGPRWGDPTLLDHAWLAEAVAAGGTGVADLYAFCWPGFVDRYRATLDEAALEVGARLEEGIRGWVAHPPPALTLTHGDYRLDNMLFAPASTDGRPLTVVDWQTVRLGCGTGDVAYFLGAGLDPPTRRAHEAGLVAHYHQALSAYDIADYGFDACWEDYRRYSFGGYVMAVIASVLVGRTERGDAMFMAMANRHAAQVTDLAALSVL
ncbi:MAG: phosphotransferase [Acidimicrobiales bacterium]